MMADVIKKATRDSYGAALVELGAKRQDLVVLDADLAAATKTGGFKKAYPDRFFDCGIAEGNMMGVAAGLAATGKKVLYMFTFPFFMLTYIPIALVALVKKCKWKPIQHSISVDVAEFSDAANSKRERTM